MTKFIFITGGVLSSLGKGISAASIGALLEARGLKVTFLKLDPYINVDPGTMSPFQHGEVFVTDDGSETDLDLGHYERFSNAKVGNKNNFTTTYGILHNSLVDENILGVVAITSPQFANTFDSGANFIYKTRHYTSPVDINRIKIKLLNTFGALVNLYDNDYAFCLEVEMLYDNLKPSSQTEIRITQ